MDNILTNTLLPALGRLMLNSLVEGVRPAAQPPADKNPYNAKGSDDQPGDIERQHGIVMAGTHSVTPLTYSNNS